MLPKDFDALKAFIAEHRAIESPADSWILLQILSRHPVTNLENQR